MERLIAIIGPTAVGKTKISIDLAKMLHTEIISGDSMLVYRGMNIGTAKPTELEREGISHHLIDFLDPHQEFSVADFQDIAGCCITEMNQRNRIPILAGGTGLYVKALLEGYSFNTAPANEEFRTDMERKAREYGNQYVHDMLAKVDADTAARLHPNDLRRIIRALEVCRFGGDTISQNKETKLKYDAIVIGLTMDRQKLYQRINDRVDIMIAQGLIEEVQTLLANGIPFHCQAMQGIGYKEVIAYLQGEMDLQSTIDKIQQATRNFAKRQLTWYRKMPYITWFDHDDFEDYDAIMASIYNLVAGKFHIK